MANGTDPSAKRIRGTDPQNLIEKITRSKVYNHPYWKQHCFGLTAETLVDKAMELDHIGGTYAKPTPFICLVVKMFQIQPDKDIVVEFIKNEDYKYVRALGAFYMRITGTFADVYQYLEPLYNDYRKLRRKLEDGGSCVTHVDEFIDELLTMESSCSIKLPRIQERSVLEANGTLEPRISALEDDFEEGEDDDEEAMETSEDDAREIDYRHGWSPIRSHRDDDKRKKQKREEKSDGIEHLDPEIVEANKLRASLGLPPLK